MGLNRIWKDERDKEAGRGGTRKCLVENKEDNRNSIPDLNLKTFDHNDHLLHKGESLKAPGDGGTRAGVGYRPPYKGAEDILMPYEGTLRGKKA